ncbi:hypothetical protein [Streptomyces sp. NPDC057910]|uniref:hypothetical protein n=1 Tax=Streptomyces sp. NPDC057910 TaxID=3346278 RepID=UPI0036E792C8
MSSEICVACGHAATGEDTLITADDGTRIHLRHTLDPRSWFYAVPAGPDPKTGDGFAAPRPEEAYANAPELLREAAEVMRLGTALTVQAAHAARAIDRRSDDAPGSNGLARERVYLLRRAALADRLAIEWPAEEPFLRDAMETSQALIAFDRRHPRFVPPGIEGPRSPEWDPSARPYTRACYTAQGWA